VTADTVRAWVAKEGVVCSLQADKNELRALDALVAADRMSVTPGTCGHLKCRHYTTRGA